MICRLLFLLIAYKLHESIRGDNANVETSYYGVSWMIACYKKTWFSRRRTRRFLWVLWILCAKISHADHADWRRFYSAWDSCYLNAISKERPRKDWLARPAIREIREIRVLSKRYSARNICSSVLLSKNTCEVGVSLWRLREKNMSLCSSVWNGDAIIWRLYVRPTSRMVLLPPHSSLICPYVLLSKNTCGVRQDQPIIKARSWWPSLYLRSIESYGLFPSMLPIVI